MATVPSPRDLLVCLHARQQELLSDAELEAVVRDWLAGPARPLLDLLVERTRLSPGQAALLQATVDRRAQETCADPLAARLRSLPTGVRRLFAAASGEPPPTERTADTRSDPASRRPASAATTAGLTPGDRFDIQQVLAQGGLGVVFLARDREIDRTVALKQIKSQWADDEDSRARFLLEARVTGRLEHPGVAPVYALGADDTGRPYYAMRLIRGESLLEVIDRFHRGRNLASPAKRMSELRKLLQRFMDVCNAVDYAHSKGVIHRDIKPSNIMMGKYGETLVVDWGLAKVIGSDEDVALTTRMAPSMADDAGGTSTRLGSAIGTPAYMSPEQAAGRIHELGPPTDVYSLGATLYQLVTGQLPHAVEDDVGVMIAAAERGHVTPPREHARWLPRPLESICLKALAPTPAARYISARALSDDVQRWLADEPVAAHRERWSERAFRWLRNHRTLATALVVAYLVATLAIVVGLIGWNHFQSERRKLQDEQRRQQSALELQARERIASRANEAKLAEQSATAELAAGRFPAALGLLNAAAETLAGEQQLAGQLAAVDAKRERVRRLARYRQQGEAAEEFAFFQQDAESQLALYDALTAIGTLDHADWWAHLPADDLTPEQLDELQHSVYRKLILLAGVQGQVAFKNMLNAEGADAAREMLAINRLVQAFRPAESTRLQAAMARVRLGQGLPIRASDLAPPENPSDAYMLGAIWLIAAQNPAIAAVIADPNADPLENAKREFVLVESLAPRDYWSHFLLAYIEMLQAGEPTTTPPLAARPHYVRARQALSHAIAIKPEHWLAYAERSGAYRQEIECRRAAGLEPLPAGWESTEKLLETMIHDIKRANDLSGQSAEARWYIAFALKTAGQIEPAVNALLEALELGNRFDAETRPRMVDPERDRGIPEAIQIADELLRASPDNPRYRLVRAESRLRLGQLAAALEDAEAALAATDPPPATWAVRGAIRLRQGEPVAARADFRRALEELPGHVASLLGMGAAHEVEGDSVDALAAYDRALPQAATGYQRAAAHLGRCRSLMALGRFDDAERALADARAAKPSCELDSVLAAARRLADDAFAAKVRELTLTPSVLDRLADPDAPFASLPLLNGNFELGLVEHWNNDDVGGLAWTNVDGGRSWAVADNKIRRSGQRSLHIVNPGDDSGGYGMTSQTVPADPRARYRLSLWARAEGLANRGLGVVLDDAAGDPIVELPAGTYDWRELSGTFDLGDSPAPEREGFKAAPFRIVSRGAGEAWLDDLHIEMLPRDDPAAEIASRLAPSLD